MPEGAGTRAGQRLVLADGRSVSMRPVCVDDIDELRRAIAGADPETLRLRFLGGRPPQTDEELLRLVDVDHVRREAVAAFAPDGHGVGIARYDAVEDPHTAEFAVVVDPEWRRVGLATALLTRLLKTALRNGIRTIHVAYFAANRDIADLVQRAGGVEPTHVESGIVEEDVPIRRDLVDVSDAGGQ